MYIHQNLWVISVIILSTSVFTQPADTEDKHTKSLYDAMASSARYLSTSENKKSTITTFEYSKNILTNLIKNLQSNEKNYLTQEQMALKSLFKLVDTPDQSGKTIEIILDRNLSFSQVKVLIEKLDTFCAPTLVWNILAHAMPYEVSSHFLGANNKEARDVPDFAKTTIIESFSRITDENQKTSLRILAYKNLYTCSAFKEFQRAAKQKRKEKKHHLDIDELIQLPEVKNWLNCNSYILFSKLVEPLNNVAFLRSNKKSNNAFYNLVNFVKKDDGFLHVPCIALYKNAIKKMKDERKESENNHAWKSISTREFINIVHVDDVDVDAFQSISEWYKRTLAIHISCVDNASIDMQVFKKLKGTFFGKTPMLTCCLTRNGVSFLYHLDTVFNSSTNKLTSW